MLSTLHFCQYKNKDTLEEIIKGISVLISQGMEYQNWEKVSINKNRNFEVFSSLYLFFGDSPCRNISSLVIFSLYEQSDFCLCLEITS